MGLWINGESRRDIENEGKRQREREREREKEERVKRYVKMKARSKNQQRERGERESVAKEKRIKWKMGGGTWELMSQIFILQKGPERKNAFVQIRQKTCWKQLSPNPGKKLTTCNFVISFHFAWNPFFALFGADIKPGLRACWLLKPFLNVAGIFLRFYLNARIQKSWCLVVGVISYQAFSLTTLTLMDSRMGLRRQKVTRESGKKLIHRSCLWLLHDSNYLKHKINTLVYPNLLHKVCIKVGRDRPVSNTRTCL